MYNLFTRRAPRFRALRDWAQSESTPPHGDAVDVTVGVDGRVHVLTRDPAAVLVYTPDGACVATWGTDLLSTRPHGITAGPDGRLFVVDEGAHAIRVLHADGTLEHTLGHPGIASDTGCVWGETDHFRDVQASIRTAAGPFNHPTKLAVAPSGDLYVSDGYGNTRIHRFTPYGTLLHSWGTPGDAPGEFRVPHAVSVSADGRVWVCDRENERLQIFDPEGTFLDQWTDVQRPAALAFDESGNVYVAELAWWEGDHSWRTGPITADAHARLSVFAPDGTLIERYGAPGSALTFDAPHGLAVDAAGALYVAEITGNLIAAGHPSSTRRTVQKLVRDEQESS